MPHRPRIETAGGDFKLGRPEGGLRVPTKGQLVHGRALSTVRLGARLVRDRLDHLLDAAGVADLQERELLLGVVVARRRVVEVIAAGRPERHESPRAGKQARASVRTAPSIRAPAAPLLDGHRRRDGGLHHDERLALEVL
jgi:hypothetical protein